jgi:hypothetical protein
MIPKILHFCFGLSSKGGDWGLVHYACVKSAIERISPAQAFLYFEYQPRGPFWDLTTKIIECKKIIAPRTVFGNPLVHYAHRADVVRLEKLIEVGGIYLDCDVLVHRDFDDLLDNSVVLGQEGDTETLGLCNAVILAEPGARFLRRWYSRYKSFRSKGWDLFWNEHSVKLPLRLTQTHPEELTILGPRAFFWPTADDQGLRRIFASNEPIPSKGVYANHLWESRAWSDYLRDLTPAHVRMVDSNFHSWVRPLVVDLPDNFGAPSLVARVVNRTRTAQLAKKGETPRRNERVRQILTALRDRHPLIDRALRNRHRFIDQGLGTMAALAANRLGSYSGFISDLYRRRTFRTIYRQYLWGADGKSPFFSGPGSRGEHAKSYVEVMVPILARHASDFPEALVVVDLGCGDFAVGSELLKSLRRVRYVGCDIVPELIDHNQWRYGIADTIEFRKLDIVRDSLPDGDVCLVRQVLQHLSNAEIAAILPKLTKYKYVYITEGQPLIQEGLPNPDKLVGADVRYDWRTGCGRGVELNLPPWNLTLQEIMRTTSTGAQDIKGSFLTYRILSFNGGPRPGSDERIRA